MPRPYLNSSIDVLESLFATGRDNHAVLNQLQSELQRRTTTRAKKLLLQVEQALEKNKPHPPESPPVLPVEQDAGGSDRKQPINKPVPAQDKPLKNGGQDILKAWTALEVLSPQSFDREYKLAFGGDKKLISKIDGDKLPWEAPRFKAKPNHRLYYQIVIGTIELQPAIDNLLKVYSDSRIEKPSVKGEAILAVAVVNHDGILVESPAVSVSSFGWGYPVALKGNLTALQGWAAEEQDVNQQLDKMLRREDADGKPIPLDSALIDTAFRFLITRFGLSDNIVKRPRFAVRVNWSFSIKEPPEPLLLNSFFIRDLISTGKLLENGKATSNLKNYLGLVTPASRIPILGNEKAFREAVSPKSTPPGRWPSAGLHPLVLLQQAAVNTSMNRLQNGGILAVNGPPGTGKTTLLRDIIAGVVVKRAEALCAFDKPEKAFTYASKLPAGNGFSMYLYKVDSKIKGHEILIASSNNKAVENVSAEIPGLKAIADNATGLRYFKTLSDGLMGKESGSESWGLIAAVLGNATNRSRFKQTFWWDSEIGLRTYFAQIAGTPQLIDILDPETGEIIGQRPPEIIQKENPPSSPEEGLLRWQEARQDFQNALKKSRAKLQELAAVEDALQNLSLLYKRAENLRTQITELQAKHAQNQAKLNEANTQLAHKGQELKRAEQAKQNHEGLKPGLLSRILSSSKLKVWEQTYKELSTAFYTASKEETEKRKKVSEFAERSKRLLAEIDKATQDYKPAKFSLEKAQQLITDARLSSKSHLLEADFADMHHDEKHKVSPWCNDETQSLRDDVFIAAMKVHKAFIDAAFKPVRNNLNALMSAFSSGSLDDKEADELLPDLWSTLFLVVPCLSTAFASVGRMLDKLPPESLGWLLIDEAGQALPQAAVGALMRTKKAVVVGDPIQIQPVVTLPETLTKAICRKFGVDDGRFNAPEASVQTLADAATSLYHEFGIEGNKRSVGIPLLVHRRCASPMFEISNAIAYDGEMVQAKGKEAETPIRRALGPSKWIHTTGEGDDKWCLAEGKKVVELLRDLRVRNVKPDLYIVTPFVIVADNLRMVIRESTTLDQWVENPETWLFERVGTVHTVQGREAEAVIFVLGAPMPRQKWVREWAGSPPNLLNVAVTRAKEALYVIGNRQLWQEAGYFKDLHLRLPP